MRVGAALEPEHCVGTLTNPTEPWLERAREIRTPRATRGDKRAPLDGRVTAGRAVLYNRTLALPTKHLSEIICTESQFRSKACSTLQHRLEARESLKRQHRCSKKRNCTFHRPRPGKTVDPSGHSYNRSNTAGKGTLASENRASLRTHRLPRPRHPPRCHHRYCQYSRFRPHQRWRHWPFRRSPSRQLRKGGDNETRSDRA